MFLSLSLSFSSLSLSLFFSLSAPSSVASVTVKSRTETALTLEWNKVNNSNIYSYRLTDHNGINISISGSEGDSVVTHTVSPLSPGTKYSLTLYTVFEGVESSGYNFTSVTSKCGHYSSGLYLI